MRVHLTYYAHTQEGSTPLINNMRLITAVYGVSVINLLRCSMITYGVQLAPNYCILAHSIKQLVMTSYSQNIHSLMFLYKLAYIPHSSIVGADVDDTT